MSSFPSRQKGKNIECRGPYRAQTQNKNTVHSSNFKLNMENIILVKSVGKVQLIKQLLSG